MKILVGNYTFDKTAKTVTFTDLASISLERVLIITNVTSGDIIYNFADSSKGGSVSTNVLTLDFNTSAMSDSDSLQIFYELSFTEDATAIEGFEGNPILGIRKDSDTSPVSTDGEYHPLVFNELGRLKVAGAPAQYVPATMSVSAIQASANTPVANATAFANVAQVSNVMAYVTGTFAGMNCTFEGSLDSTNGTDGTWFTIQAVRSNANTVETTTGALSASPVYAWEMSVNALAYVRVRCTARTSGTQNWRFTLGSYATEPIPASQVSGTQPVSGSVTATPATPTALNINSAASTNATVVKATAGSLYAISASNINAATRYLKLYNKTTAPTVGTDIPIMIIPIPANSRISESIGAIGHRFTSGIGLALTTGIADNDTGAVASGEIKVTVSYI